MGKNIAIRDAYGAAFEELGEQDKRIVSLKADVVSPTKSGIFRRVFPERYSSVGISELDTVPTSAGFAREGLIPLVNAFVVLLTTRGADSIQSPIAYNRLGVKLCGAYCKLSDSYDRASHQTITDLTFARAIPSMMMVTVVDAVETKKAVSAIAGHQGPVYLRLNRAAIPAYYSGNTKFEIGKGITVRNGRGMTIIITGTVLHKALVAAEFLEAEGTRARVVDMHTIKPIDEELIMECVRETGAIVAVEEHSACGRLGSAVAEVLAEHMPVFMIRIGATDFVEPRDYEQLLVKYGYGPESIAERCAEVIKRK